MRHLLFVAGIVIMAGCSAARKAAVQTVAVTINEIRFINEYIFPNDIQFKNTIIGGLSGIDYDAARDVYLPDL